MEVLPSHSLPHISACPPREEGKLVLGEMLTTGAGFLCHAVMVCLLGSSLLPGAVCKCEGR